MQPGQRGVDGAVLWRAWTPSPLATSPVATLLLCMSSDVRLLADTSLTITLERMLPHIWGLNE